MLRRSFQIIKRFKHEHSHKPNAFLPKNDFKIDYNKCHESEDKINKLVKDTETLNKNILDIKKSVEKNEFCIEMTAIALGSYAFTRVIAYFIIYL
jgi:hypothetical protein